MMAACHSVVQALGMETRQEEAELLAQVMIILAPTQALIPVVAVVAATVEAEEMVAGVAVASSRSSKEFIHKMQKRTATEPFFALSRYMLSCQNNR